MIFGHFWSKNSQNKQFSAKTEFLKSRLLTGTIIAFGFNKI